MNGKALILALLLIVLLAIMFTRWESVPGESPYHVKRDKLTSITREYLPGRHVYSSEQDRYIVGAASFFLYVVIGLTVNELYKELGLKRAPEKEPGIDIVTHSSFYGWGKVVGLIIVVIIIVILVFVLRTIPKLT